MIASFLKNIFSSLLVTVVISLVGLCFMTGQFPPKPDQLKKMWVQYKKVLQLQQKVATQNPNLPTEDLALAFEQTRQQELSRLAAVTASSPGAMAVEDPFQEEQPPAPRVEEVDLASKDSDQISQLRFEVLRLNQRLVEIEKRLDASRNQNQ
jgi:hypothetical protein